MVDHPKKFNIMEPTLQRINKDFIALDRGDVKAHNVIIHENVDKIINHLKRSDSLFNELYQSNYYGGSFYDNLKYGQPDEYDIEILLILPKCNSCGCRECDCIEIQLVHELPGTVKMKFNDSYFGKSKQNISSLVEHGYLDANHCKNWIRSIVHKALNDLDEEMNIRIITFGQGLILELNDEINIRLVPAFKFGENKWPFGYKKINNYLDPGFTILSKGPHYDQESTHWFLSFQSQESKILTGLNRLKPVIRLLKKLRDNFDQTHRIPDYYIKTIALWAVAEKQDADFWMNNSLSYIFMWMLKRYRSNLSKCEILNYWYPSHNLLSEANPDTIMNDYNRINRAIADIELNLDDPLKIAQYILSSSEYDRFKASGTPSSTSNQQQSTYDFYQPTAVPRERFVWSSMQPSASTQRQQTVQSEQKGTDWGTVAAGAGALALGGALLYGLFSSGSDNKKIQKNNIDGD